MDAIPGGSDAGLETTAADGPAADRGPSDAGPGSRGLVLHWTLDDAPGTAQARDSSPNALHGAYVGQTHSAERAPTLFANIASRRFTSSSQAITLTSSEPRLRPAAITVSFWFRTTLTARADLLAYNADYFVRYMPPELEFVRRRPLTGTVNYVTANAMVTANDDRWHHVAGTADSTHTALWLDGRRVNRDAAAIAPVYTAGMNVLTVGRGMSGMQAYPGWIDDIRIYDRVLTAEEILALGRGDD